VSHPTRRLCEDKIRFTEGPSGHQPRISAISLLGGGSQPGREYDLAGEGVARLENVRSVLGVLPGPHFFPDPL